MEYKMPRFINLRHRADVCNNSSPMLCFITLRPLENTEDVAFAYNSEIKGSVPIHKDFNTPEIRAEWMKYEKECMLESANLIPGMEDTMREYIERTFPKV
jgi:hypothetical protein